MNTNPTHTLPLPADTALPWRCVPTNRRSAKAGRRVDVRDALGRIVANYVLPEVGALLCAAGNARTPDQPAGGEDFAALPDAELERRADDLAHLADDLTGDARRAALADAYACERELARRRSASVLLAAAA